MHFNVSGISTGNNLKKGWYKVGEPAKAPIKLRAGQIQMFGALAPTGFIYDFYESANEDALIDFLKTIHREYGKVVIYMDNASYNKSCKVMETVKKYKGNMILKYIPPYTPELNLVEIQWRMIKKAIGNMVFEGVNDLIDMLDYMIANHEIDIVRMSDRPWR